MIKTIPIRGFDKDGEPELTWDEVTGALRIHFNFMPPSNGGEARRFEALFEEQFAKILSKQAGKKVTREDREVFVAVKVKEPRLNRLVQFLESFWSEHAQVELTRFHLKEMDYVEAYAELGRLGQIPDALHKESLRSHHGGYLSLLHAPELLVDLKRIEIVPSDAKCRTLPAGIAQCLKLQKVTIWDMERIDLRKTIEQLSGLPKLKHLDFTNCRFDAFPDNITALKKLKVLVSSDNGLTSLAACLADMPKLKKLRIYEEDTLTRSVVSEFRKFLKKANKKIDFDAGSL